MKKIYKVVNLYKQKHCNIFEFRTYDDLEEACFSILEQQIGHVILVSDFIEEKMEEKDESHSTDNHNPT